MQRPDKLRPGEILFALAALAVAVAAFREAYLISGFSGLTTGGVVPMAAAATMILSGLFIVVDVLKRRAGGRASLVETLKFLFPLRLVILMVLIALYAAAIPWLGFMAASAGFLFLAIASLWRGKIVWTAAITVTAIAAIYGLFRLVFQVVLPSGSIFI